MTVRPPPVYTGRAPRCRTHQAWSARFRYASEPVLTLQVSGHDPGLPGARYVARHSQSPVWKGATPREGWRCGHEGSTLRVMSHPDVANPEAVALALAEAMNAHDIDAFVSLFAADYDSRQPAHPDRAFVGRDQVRANWSAVFAGVPDFRAELIATAVEADTLWSEWHWRGTHEDGSALDMAGVIVCGVRAGTLAWARLYVEPVESGGEGIDAAVRDMAGRD